MRTAEEAVLIKRGPLMGVPAGREPFLRVPIPTAPHRNSAARAAAALCALSALLSLAAGCGQFSESYSLGLAVPRLPEHWSESGEITAYELRWIAHGGERRRRIELNEAAAGRIGISLPKRPNVAVLAYPVTYDGALLEPAGTIAPLRLRSGRRLPLRFEDGPGAYLLYRLDRDGRGAAGVNARRLLREIEERLGEARWRLDWVAVLDAFERGVFRATMLRPVPQHPVVICLPPGAYRSAEVRAEPLVVPEEGCSDEIALAEGVHRLFSDDGRLTVTLQIDRNGRFATVTAPRRAP